MAESLPIETPSQSVDGDPLGVNRQAAPEVIQGSLQVTGAVGFNGNAPAAKAGAIAAPNTQTGAYVQADVQSIVTAVNAIRAALSAVGITA